MVALKRLVRSVRHVVSYTAVFTPKTNCSRNSAAAATARPVTANDAPLAATGLLLAVVICRWMPATG